MDRLSSLQLARFSRANLGRLAAAEDLAARRGMPQGAPLPMDPYFYVITYLPLAAAAAGIDGSFTVEQEADFDMQWLTYFATSADASQTEQTRVIPIVTVSLSTTDTRKLMSLPLPISAMFGSGALPMVLKKPKRLLARQQVTAT